MSELKPCPFCGPGTQVTKYRDDYNHWRVACGACGLHTGYNPRDTDGSRTVARWNTRPKSEAEELLDLQGECFWDVFYLEGRWLAELSPVHDTSREIGRGKTPLDALRAAREAMKDET